MWVEEDIKACDTLNIFKGDHTCAMNIVNNSSVILQFIGIWSSRKKLAKKSIKQNIIS